ncbi:MAG: HD domain-containing protein, partial [Candidatus Marinimicrobia bacterium]|nr:HD domain-containing protein [Candidatus Neomarinimicrobiota bacterium]
DEIYPKMDDDSDFASALIDARALPSNPRLIKKFYSHLNKYFDKGNEEFLRIKMKEDQSRRLKYGNTYKLLEPNIKESAGGQRDLHTIQWLLVAKGLREPGVTPEQTLATYDLLHWMLNENLVTVREYAAIKDAYGFILKIRHGIHELGGVNKSKSDHLDINMRHKLAEAFGYLTEGNPDEQAFMQAYYRAAREIDYAHNFFISERVNNKNKKWWHINRARKLGEFPGLIRDTGVIYWDKDTQIPKNPVLLVEIFQYAQKHQLQLSRSARDQIEHAVHSLSANDFQTVTIGEKLGEILVTQDAAEILRALQYTEILVRIIPEIEKIHRLHIKSMYHHYTVDEHTFRTIEIMQSVIFDESDEEHQLFRDVYFALEDPLPIYLGLLLHDIGKAEDREAHHEIGAGMVYDILKRLGLERYAADVAFLIQNHLIMEQNAFRRDVNRIETVSGFAEMVKNERLLKMMYLLTYADISAVKPDLWTDWKSTLLMQLYLKTERYLRGESIQPESKPIEAMDEAVQAEYHEHIDDMGPRYASLFSDKSIGEHLQIIQQLRNTRNNGGDKEVHFMIGKRLGFTEITVITPDREKLLSTICGVLTSYGFNIMDAAIFTREEGIALDEFTVVSVLPDEIKDEKLSSEMEKTLVQIFHDEQDVNKLVAEAEQRFRLHRKPLGKVAPKIIWSEENDRIVVEITGRDRLGILFNLTRIFSETGFNIHSAKIHTENQTITDVFYLSIADQKTISDDRKNEMKRVLEERLLEFLQ